MSNFKFKRIHISSREEFEVTLTETSHPHLYFKVNNRSQFLETINRWNEIALIQSSVTNTIEWMYIAL